MVSGKRCVRNAMASTIARLNPIENLWKIVKEKIGGVMGEN